MWREYKKEFPPLGSLLWTSYKDASGQLLHILPGGMHVTINLDNQLTKATLS